MEQNPSEAPREAGPPSTVAKFVIGACFGFGITVGLVYLAILIAGFIRTLN
jgi:hypothetical protein